MRHRIARGLLLASVLVGAFPLTSAPPVRARSAEATFRVQVPPGAWKSARVRNIPAGARLSVEVESDGAIGLQLLDEVEYARFPAGEALFSGRTERRLSFTLRAPRTGHYYVLVDNRDGQGERSVSITVRGSSDGPGEPPAAQPDPQDERSGENASAEARLAEFQTRLGQLFVFEPFPIEVQSCQRAWAFSRDGGVVLCREYAAALYARLGDQTKASHALAFTLFHEVGHVLLEQWNHPLYENEEAADEFATAVMVMVGQGERVRAKAEFFRSNPSALEALSKLFRDDRHPLSQQRARNLLRWVDDPNLVRRWQTLFVPHLQTEVLEGLNRQPAAWTDVALVRDELASRAR